MAFDIECTPPFFFFLSFFLSIFCYFFSPLSSFAKLMAGWRTKDGKLRRSLYGEKGCLCCFCTERVCRTGLDNRRIAVIFWYCGNVEKKSETYEERERERKRNIFKFCLQTVSQIVYRSILVLYKGILV